MPGGTRDVFFRVDDVAALHSEFADRAAIVVYGPVFQQPCQMQEFAVRDGDGHVLGFILGRRRRTEKLR